MDTDIFPENDQMSVLMAWIGIVAYAFQIYFDFSGYSDMAIGLGAILGFHFPENFNYPYIATSVTDFGTDGIFPSAPGSRNMYIFPWAVTARDPPDRSSIY